LNSHFERRPHIKVHEEEGPREIFAAEIDKVKEK
jgi:hypothetical protein